MTRSIWRRRRSSTLFEYCREMSMPISFITAMALGWTPAGMSPALKGSIRTFPSSQANPSAICERQALPVQRNITWSGCSVMVRILYHVPPARDDGLFFPLSRLFQLLREGGGQTACNDRCGRFVHVVGDPAEVRLHSLRGYLNERHAGPRVAVFRLADAPGIDENPVAEILAVRSMGVAVDHDVGIGLPRHLAEELFRPILIPVEVVLPGSGVEEHDLFPFNRERNVERKFSQILPGLGRGVLLGPGKRPVRQLFLDRVLGLASAMLRVVRDCFVVVSLDALDFVFDQKNNNLIEEGGIAAQVSEVVYFFGARRNRHSVRRLQGLDIPVYVSEHRYFHHATHHPQQILLRFSERPSVFFSLDFKKMTSRFRSPATAASGIRSKMESSRYLRNSSLSLRR